MRSFWDDATRQEILDRLGRLQPDAPPRWGRMTAPRMVAHLTDQMGHTLGDKPCAPRYGPLRWPLVGKLWVYWLPWPRGRVRGPADAFVTQPLSWESDVAALVTLVERFAARGPAGEWAEHFLFGRMSGRDWGRFCYRHFHHHLSQFGV